MIEQAKLVTIRRDDDGEHRRAAVRLPREGLLGHGRSAGGVSGGRGRGVVHAPRPDPAVPMPRPHHPVGAVDRGAERRRDRHGLPERRGLLVAAALRPGARSPPAERLVETPHPDPGLGARPQLPPPRVARQCPQEGAHLRLPQRVRAGRVHRRAERHAEDALAPAGADELRQRAAVLRHGPLQCRRHRRRRRRAAVDPGGEGGRGGERRLAVAVAVALRERRAALRRGGGGGDRIVTVAEHAWRDATGARGRGGRLRVARLVQVDGFPLRRRLVVRVHVPARDASTNPALLFWKR